MYVHIETERLKLRPINLKDTKFIIDLVNSDGWMRFIGDRNVTNENEAENYIQKILDDRNIYYSVFELKQSEKSIGIVTFINREEEQFPDLGFALLPEFENKGYTFEASKAYLENITSLQKFNNIIAITKPDNQRSISLLKKLGFHYKENIKKEVETLSYYSYKNAVTNVAKYFSFAEALKLGPAPEGNLAIPVFSHGSMEAELYTPEKIDGQSPHSRDEIYFVAKGNGQFFNGEELIKIEEGSFIFVPAGVEHRFENFSKDLAVWVIFYGPDGGE